MELRSQHLTYAEIARRCGYASPGAARNAIMRELSRRINPDADMLRKEEGEFYEAMMRRIWLVAFPEGKDPNLWAVDRLLNISRERRALLGLDAEPVGSAATGIIREYVGISVEGISGPATNHVSANGRGAATLPEYRA